MSMNVSDLAPLVAAALRDRVVDDLLADNRELQSTVQCLRAYKQRLGAEGPSWIVRITGPDGTPDYATGTNRLLQRSLEGDDDNLRHDARLGLGFDEGNEGDEDEVRSLQGDATIPLYFEGGDALCRFDALFECRLVLTSEDGLPDKVFELDDLLNQLKYDGVTVEINDGRFNFEWVAGYGGFGWCRWFEVDMPVSSGCPDCYYVGMDPVEALSLARATVSSDAPVRFQNVEFWREGLRKDLTGLDR